MKGHDQSDTGDSGRNSSFNKLEDLKMSLSKYIKGSKKPHEKKRPTAPSRTGDNSMINDSHRSPPPTKIINIGNDKGSFHSDKEVQPEGKSTSNSQRKLLLTTTNMIKNKTPELKKKSGGPLTLTTSKHVSQILQGDSKRDSSLTKLKKKEESLVQQET